MSDIHGLEFVALKPPVRPKRHTRRWSLGGGHTSVCSPQGDCPNCGAGELKIIAAILERPVIEKILTHLGLDPQPPPRGRAREAGQD
jgi:hypothetical protein